MGRIKPSKSVSKGSGGRLRGSVASTQRATASGKRRSGLQTALSAVTSSVAGRAIIGVAKRHPLLATAGLAIGGIAAIKGIRALRARGQAGMRRRKGIVPKTVKKYVARMVRKRKQENKIIRKLISSSGAGRLFTPRAASSSGVITRAEASRALKR